jgi:hypothetical protein
LGATDFLKKDDGMSENQDGDHFPDFPRLDKAIAAAKAADAMLYDCEQRIAALEAALAKQRAVNRTLHRWGVNFHTLPIEAMDALSDALK